MTKFGLIAKVKLIMNNTVPDRLLLKVGIIAFVMVIVPLTTYLVIRPTQYVGRAENSPKEFVSSQSAPTSWPVYTNKNFGYSLSYPPEFNVEERGKVGNLADLVAFNFRDGSNSITVAKIEIRNQPPSTQSQSVSKGMDGDGNAVAVYSFPYGKDKTLVLIGTVYPKIGGGSQFGQTLDLMAKSLKISAQ